MSKMPTKALVILFVIIAFLAGGIYIARQNDYLSEYFAQYLDGDMTFSEVFTSLDFVDTPLQEVSGILDIKEIESESGLRAWLVQDSSVPVITMHFGFRDAGSATDPLDKQGLARLVSNTMDEGAGELDSQNFQRELQNNSIRLQFFTDRDRFGGSLQTLSTNKEKAFELLTLALTKPRFDEEPLSRMKAANIARIKSDFSKPNWRVARLGYQTAFDGHPYAKNSGGTVSGLNAVTSRDLEKFIKTYLGKNNLVIGISGDITEDDARNAIDKVFGYLPERSSKTTVSDTRIKNPSITVHHPMDTPQTHIQMWHSAESRTSKDYPKLVILNNILGESGFGSRLMDTAREQRGLTYGIYSYFQHFNHASALVISTSTKNERVGDMLDIIKTEINTLSQEGISENELQTTKDYLIGSFPLEFTSNANVSRTLMNLQLESLPIDYLDQFVARVEAVTLKEANKAVRHFLDSDQFVTILVGDPQGLARPPERVIETIPNAK